VIYGKESSVCPFGSGGLFRELLVSSGSTSQLASISKVLLEACSELEWKRKPTALSVSSASTLQAASFAFQPVGPGSRTAAA